MCLLYIKLVHFHSILDIVVADSNKQVVASAMSAFALMPYYAGQARFPTLIAHIRHKYFGQVPPSNFFK